MVIKKTLFDNPSMIVGRTKQTINLKIKNRNIIAIYGWNLRDAIIPQMSVLFRFCRENKKERGKSCVHNLNYHNE